MANEETLTQPTESAADIKRQKLNQAYKELKEAFETGIVIEVEVIEKIKGGFKTLYNELTVFLPTRLYTSKRELSDEEVNSIVGTKLKVKVIEFIEDDLARIVKISHRHFLEDEQWKNITVDSIVTGTVKTILKDKLILDVDGIDALVHISQLSRHHVSDINEFAKVGDVLKAKITKTDKDNHRMFLSLKELPDVNWENFFDKHKVGDKVNGKVVSIANNGVMIEISPNIRGFLKMSEISWLKREVDINAMFPVDTEVETEIINVDREKSRIDLSYKKLLPDNWGEVADKYQVGYTYTATIEMIPPNGQGAVVSINDEIDGFVPKKRMLALYTENKPNFKRKDTIQVKLVDKDNEKKSLIFESIIKPEIPIENKDNNDAKNNRNYRDGNSSHEAVTPKPTVINNYSLADLLSESSKKNLNKK